MDFAGLGWMPWRPAAALGISLLIAWPILRAWPRMRPVSSLVFELGLIFTLYAGWQYVGAIKPGGALESANAAGQWVVDAERWLHWPSEQWIQALALPHDGLIAFADWYYSSLHIPVFVVTLAWVLVRHRPDWPFARTTTVLLTGACLLIQFKPVAPPRLMPHLGIVDTALEHGRSVYAAIPGANQLAAMPSVHIAWAALVALFIIVSAGTAWRWLALIYPVMTMWVVVVTGNHFIMDGAVALALLAVAVGITLLFPSQRPRRALALLPGGKGSVDSQSSSQREPSCPAPGASRGTTLGRSARPR